MAGVSGETIYVNGLAATSLNASEWSHVAVVFSSAVNSTQFNLATGNSGYFSGKMDECRLWSDARSQNEIQTNLHSVLTGSEADLAAYYSFDHASGAELSDVSSNGLHGILDQMTGDEWTESTFPVGDIATWMTSGSQTLADLTVTYQDGSSGALGVFSTGSGGSWLQQDNGLFLDKSWGVEQHSGTVTAQLNFDLSSQTLPDGKNWSDVDLFTRSDKVSSWQNITDLCTHTPTSAEPWFTITRSSFSEFQPVLDSPIPVTLSRFEVAVQDSGVLLSWQVENSVNMAGFFIGRARADHDEFVRITRELIPASPSREGLYEFLDDHVISGRWRYRLESVDLNGEISRFAPIEINLLQTAVQGKELPLTFVLYPNHPNPFNPVTRIAYDIPERTNVNISVYNSLGRLVRQLVQSKQAPGHYELTWDGRDDSGIRLSSGIYLIVLDHQNGRRVQKAALIQ